MGILLQPDFFTDRMPILTMNQQQQSSYGTFGWMPMHS